MRILVGSSRATAPLTFFTLSFSCCTTRGIPVVSISCPPLFLWLGIFRIISLLLFSAIEQQDRTFCCESFWKLSFGSLNKTHSFSLRRLSQVVLLLLSRVLTSGKSFRDLSLAQWSLSSRTLALFISDEQRKEKFSTTILPLPFSFSLDQLMVSNHYLVSTVSKWLKLHSLLPHSLHCTIYRFSSHLFDSVTFRSSSTCQCWHYFSLGKLRVFILYIYDL